MCMYITPLRYYHRFSRYTLINALTLHAASMVLHNAPAEGSQWNTWATYCSWAECIMKLHNLKHKNMTDYYLCTYPQDWRLRGPTPRPVTSLELTLLVPCNIRNSIFIQIFNSFISHKMIYLRIKMHSLIMRQIRALQGLTLYCIGRVWMCIL